MTASGSVLFVCLGNICRSPLARVIFTHHAAERGVLNQLVVDSCGTGAWHVGKGADARSVSVAESHGISLIHTARALDPGSDFSRFRWLIAMDRENRDGLFQAGAPRDRVHLIRSFDPSLAGVPEHLLDVPDPYWGRDDGFERVYDMLTASCEGLLHRVLNGD